MSRGDFWSRRKAAVEAERAAERRAEEARTEAAEVEQKQAALADKTDAEICAEFGLPDPDDLRPGDKIAGFLKKEIPERLRRRALRKLWGSNPVLACLDGLNDYDDDYTNNATDAPGLKSAYQVGRGLKRHVDAMAAQAEQETAAPENVNEPAPEETQTAGDYAEEPQIPQDTDDAAPAATTKVAVESSVHHGTQETEPERTPAPRRMRFRFDRETG